MERITLNIIPKGITPVCHASQFDIGRVIRCDIMDDLQGYVFSDETVELRVRKPDDNVVTASVDVVSGDTFVLIETTEQMTACDGVNKCELRIMKGDVRIGSLNFDMKVEVDPLKDGIESETEIHNLETQIHDMNEAMLPDMVAEEVTRQYDSENVIFDDEPTENHGDGYTVNSAGLKSYIPKAIDELDDVEINNPQENQAIVYDPVSGKFKNGEVSTVGGLNDLNDVTLENVADKQELVYDDTDDVFKNKTTRVELTQTEYDALVSGGTVLPDVDYYITDAPSMQGTSADLSYDGTTLSTHDKIEGLSASDISFTPTTTINKTNVQAAISEVATRYSVKDQITFTEDVTNTNTQAWLKNGNLFIYYQGENKAHGVNDVFFTLPSNLRPRFTSYAPFVINGGAFGAVEIARETGIAKITQLSNNASGRVYFHCVIPLYD